MVRKEMKFELGLKGKQEFFRKIKGERTFQAQKFLHALQHATSRYTLKIV